MPTAQVAAITAAAALLHHHHDRPPRHPSFPTLLMKGRLQVPGRVVRLLR